MKSWMIYGANGYTGELIARQAVAQGLKPILAGRNESKLRPLAEELNLPWRVFSLDHVDRIAAELNNTALVLHCAGPFSATAAPMIQACLNSGTHYLDITGEISVFDYAQQLHEQAEKAGIMLCPGVGFDVIPTDCVAARLKQAMPEATSLRLGFDSRSGLSPGTAKTTVEGLGQGGKVRRNGQLVQVPLAYKARKIDFGDGEKLAVTIPWGDVSTAFVTTGIADIEVYIPSSPRQVKMMKRLNWIRPLLGTGLVQRQMKKRAGQVRGPNAEKRAKHSTYVWGEARNALGESVQCRIKTANGYDVTVSGSLMMVAKVLLEPVTAGYTTPSLLAGAQLVTQLPGSGEFELQGAINNAKANAA